MQRDTAFIHMCGSLGTEKKKSEGQMQAVKISVMLLHCSQN